MLDDDVVEAPERWDETLLHAYRRLPEIGFSCASIAYDPDDSASPYLRYMREEVGAFSEGEVNGFGVLHGSVGGACTMTARDLYERVGGFGEHPKYPYWRWEVPYLRAIRKLGYDSAYLVELEVRHEGERDPTRVPCPKVDYYFHEVKTRARKDRAKRAILAIPFAAALNRRYRWFDPPLPPFDPEGYDPVSPAGPRMVRPKPASGLAVHRPCLAGPDQGAHAQGTRRNRRACSALCAPSYFASCRRCPRTCSR